MHRTSNIQVLTLFAIVFGLLFACCGFATAQEEKDILFRLMKNWRAADGNHDGKVVPSEFWGSERTFAFLDSNRDGAITEDEILEAKKDDRLAPTYSNVPYGPHERNVLDFWKAKSSKPTPLVVFIHGGHFAVGGKEKVFSQLPIQTLLDAKISVAAINYRRLDNAPLPAAHEDAVRAVQFLRAKASEWNIDKKRVGACGGSAGAQISMYLAFKDEQAKPDSADPVERESSRLTCVATSGGQITMNFDLWREWIPGGFEAPPEENLPDGLTFFGAKTKEEYLAKARLVAALELISADDPPIFMTYRMAPKDPVPEDPKQAYGWKAHHVVFGVKLKEKTDALGVEAYLHYPGAETKYSSSAEFFIAKLTK